MNETIETGLVVAGEVVLHDAPATRKETIHGKPEEWLTQLVDHGETVTTVGSEPGAIGVVVHASKKPARDAHGRLLPGQSGNPSGKSKADVALIRAIADAFQPAEVVMMVRSAWESAVARNSPRAKLEIAEFIADRIAGKPKQYVSMTKGSPAEWLDALAGMQLGTSDNDGETIEAE